SHLLFALANRKLDMRPGLDVSNHHLGGLQVLAIFQGCYQVRLITHRAGLVVGELGIDQDHTAHMMEPATEGGTVGFPIGFPGASEKFCTVRPPSYSR